MAESSVKKKVYIVTNPGSDSDDSNEDLIRHLRGHGFHHYRRPRHQPSYNDYQQHRPPPQTTADHPPVNGSSSLHHPPPQYPILIESNESPTFEETPTAQTMSPTPSLSQQPDLSSRVQSPPKSSLSPEPPIYYDRNGTENPLQQPFVGSRKFPTPKPPFGSRPKPTGDNLRRSRLSPTTAVAEPCPPSASTPPLPTTSSEKIVMVTADSDRYVKVDISVAKTALHIRELILNKLNIFDEDECHPYSIYRTEIGSFAIGDALSNENLLVLCRDQGDSKGSLKFFVSVASAPAHEAPSSNQAIEQHTVPPVLPSMVNVNPLSYSKRRSRSRNGSFSSQSENKDGYDADLDNPDRDSSKPVTRVSPQQSGAILPSSASASQSQSSRRRPSAVHARPSSPLIPPEQSAPSQPSSWGHRREEKYAHVSPPILPAGPPPLSPKQASFSTPDEPLSSVVPRHPPPPPNPNLVVEREMTTKVSEPPDLSNQPTPSENRSSNPPSREILNNGHLRRPYDEDEAWDSMPTSSPMRIPDDPERISPSTSRGTRPQLTSGNHFRSTPPYNSRRPVPPPISSLQDNRPSQQRTGRQQPLPFSYVAYWKGEEVVSKKPSITTKSFSLGRGVMKPKSMDNLKLTSPTSASNWRNSPPALPTRPSGNIGYSPSSNLSVSGTPKSYEPPRGHSFVRPLPAQGSPLPSEFIPTSAGDPTLRFPTNLTSPTHDPFPRPSSAAGDSNTSPTSIYPKVVSPGYGSMLDPGDSHRSPRAVSPHRGFPLSGGINGPRTRPNNYSDPSDRSSDIQSGPETSTSTPPRTPVSPQSPRYEPQEKKGIVFDSSLSSPVDSPSDNKPSETITYDTRRRFADSVNRTTLDEATSRPQLLATSQAAPQSDPKGAYGADDDDDDESDNGGGTWIVPPGANPKSPRPHLNVQIDDGSPLTVTARPSHRSEIAKDATLLRRDALSSKQPHRRPHSIFVDDDDDSWAPRPPPENIYDDLEKFFPTHDLDRPVIDTTPGDTSPTATEAAAALPPPIPVNDEKSRMRSKKSIRIVAQDFKKKYDRTSKAETSHDKNMLRKRNTKLWGSRLEEVTTGHSRSLTSSPDSPSGGPTTFKWIRGELIGKGTYGRVYLALNATTGEMIAVKQVELPQTASDKADSRQHMVVQALKSESETLRDLDHPNIVQYLGFEETPANLSIFLEYVPGGSVGRSLLKHGRFEDNVTRSFTGQILGGLEYLHSKGILHRDLKADNILVEMTGVCKISDFGISKRTEDLHGGAFTAMQGSVFWMAPEVINTQKSGYNNKIDIWSVGCVVLEMWAGMRPWNGEEMLAVMFKLYQSKQPPPIPEDVVLSDEADDFRRKCFAINPDDRPSAPELRKHPYLVLPPNWIFTGFT